MLITRFFRKLSILKQADIFLPFKTDRAYTELTIADRYARLQAVTRRVGCKKGRLDKRLVEISVPRRASRSAEMAGRIRDKLRCLFLIRLFSAVFERLCGPLGQGNRLAGPFGFFCTRNDWRKRKWIF